MAKVIGIMGESGSGKTTAMRTLPPKETFYIDCDGKGLSWKGWRSQYSKENQNYYASDVPEKVWKALSRVSKEQTQVKYIVVDTLNGIMIGDEMRRVKEKGYDKWIDLAQCVFDIVVQSYSLREDLTVIFIMHSQTDRDDNGYMFTKVKTNGKKLDKICLESKLTTVLLAKCINGRYVFETRSNNSTCKTPMGAFETDEIDNDIMVVIEALKEF